VYNARVLDAGGGVEARLRLSGLLPSGLLEAALARTDVALLVVDAPGQGAKRVAQALRDSGAFAHADGVRLVAAGHRDAFAAVATALGETAGALAAELLRAFDASHSRPGGVRWRGYRLDLSRAANVMAILNVTPDSFYDGGKYSGLDRLRARAAELVRLGAGTIDIGGQSYAHWNGRIDAAEEAARVVPVVAALVRDGIGVPLSIDTFKADVAEAALDAGADLINDCSGLSDQRLVEVVARYDAGLVVMHLKGELNVRTPDAYRYDDALGEIMAFLRERIERALAAGVSRESIAVDPGLEFGKEPETDLEILERFGELRSLGYPIVLAASRKSFIGRIFDLPAKDLLVPSLGAAAVGIAAGAAIVRTHDVAETAQLARMLAVARLGSAARDGTFPVRRAV
jgi:dihydropteroate synthase